MKYLMLVCVDPDTDLKRDEVAADGLAWAEEMDARDVRIVGNRLRPVSEVRTVRVRDNEPLVSDGPFAETKDRSDWSALDEAIGQLDRCRAS